VLAGQAIAEMVSGDISPLGQYVARVASPIEFISPEVET
jgi:hypothetical protein